MVTTRSMKKAKLQIGADATTPNQLQATGSEPGGHKAQATDSEPGRHKAQKPSVPVMSITDFWSIVIQSMTLPKEADSWDMVTRELLKQHKAVGKELDKNAVGTKLYGLKSIQLELEHRDLMKKCCADIWQRPKLARKLREIADKTMEEMAAQTAREDAMVVLKNTQRNLEAKVRVNMLRHTTRECYALVNAVRATFPTEICDMVYRYVVKDAEEEAAKKVYVYHMRKDGINTLFHEPAHYSRVKIPSFPNKYLPLCVRPEYVGRTIAEEGAKIFYESRNPDMYLYCIGDLQNTLKLDRLGLNVNPALILRALNIEIAVTNDFYDQGHSTVALRSNCIQRCQVTGEHLAPLRGLKLKSDFRLKLRIGPKRRLLRRGIDANMIIKQLQPVYDELKAAGMIIEVMLG